MQTSATKQFIEKARKIHEDFYNYDKVDYIHSKLKVIITCPIHGDFELTPNKHLMGQGCPKCGRIRSTDAHRDNKESFIEKARKVHGNKYDYSKVNYVNSKTKVVIICPKHGEFEQSPASHLSGQGCTKCGHENAAIVSTKSVEYFLLKAKEIHGDKYDYSEIEYINTKTPVYIICHHKDKYGNEHGGFWQIPKEHMNNRGCPKCKLKHQTELYNKLKIIFPNEEILYEVNKKNSSLVRKPKI